MSVRAANRESLGRLQRGTAMLADIQMARDVVPGMSGRLVLHSGPPVPWNRMCGPMRGAVIGACLFEGWAATPKDAISLAASGGLTFDSCHHHRAVGPMAGIITPSMAVYVVRNTEFGNEAYATINPPILRRKRLVSRGGVEPPTY